MNLLTPQQKKHYQTFGFVILPRLLSAEEMETIRRESEEIYAEEFGDEGLQPKERMALQPFFERRPFMTQLMDDDRIYGIGEDLLGADFVLDGTEGHRHAGDTHWHGSDGTRSVLHIIKIALYLDPLTRETGCLRFIPGSHNPEFAHKLTGYRGFQHDPEVLPFGIPHEDVPCVAFEPDVGDVAVFTETCYHASYGGVAGRCQLAINFFENPTTDEQISSLTEQYERANFSFRPTRTCVDSDRPRLRRMVSRLMELGHETLEY